MNRGSSISNQRSYGVNDGSAFNIQKINEASIVEVSTELSKITVEDRYLAMLGYKDLNREYGKGGLLFYREEFCGACGIVHSNPEVLDTYTNCQCCFSVIREPCVLRKKYQHVKIVQPMEILFASYGDPFDPSAVIIVTTIMQERLKEFESRDRFVFRPNEDASETFGSDPAPGKNKQLRLRYRLHEGGGHGTIMLDFNQDNRIPSTFFFIVPKRSYLRINQATYGHPKGTTKTGRMSFDVTEIIQSMVHQNGGSYLSLSAFMPVARIFGDPCPGYVKDLRINFEIIGRKGSIKYPENRGHLMKKISIMSSPTITPLIYVLSATYGITPTARKDRLDYLSKQLTKVQYFEHRKREGIALSAEETLLVKKKSYFQQQKEIFLTAETKFIDISYKLQQIADQGKNRLFLDPKSFDCNAVFGNPLPGIPKILECHLDCQGHDSERNTESNEMTETGYARNYITVKTARLNCVVEDNEKGEGILTEALDFHTDCSAPIIIVTRATYGILSELQKLIDVTNEIQGLVVGNTLKIERELNLKELFKMDPAPGRQKEIQIDYITRGFQGNIRVREKKDLLIAGIELGYPPLPPPDDDKHVIH
jgi:hypothetical protein